MLGGQVSSRIHMLSLSQCTSKCSNERKNGGTALLVPVFTATFLLFYMVHLCYFSRPFPLVE